MRVISWDSETFLIRDGLAAPQMVCMTWDDGAGDKGIVLADEGVKMFRAWLESENVILVAHNAAYDWGVMAAEDHTLLPLIFKGVEDGRLRCTKIRDKIIANVTGELKFEWDEDLEEVKKSRFDLQTLVRKYFDVFVPKGQDTWRKRYSELHKVPIAEWPEDAIKYAIDDATWTHKIYVKQDQIAGAEIPGENHVSRTSWALSLLRIWGVRTDGEAVAALKAELSADYEKAVTLAQQCGLVRVDRKRTRDMNKIKEHIAKIYDQYGLTVPLTDSGKNVSTDRETINFKRFPKIPRNEISLGVRCVDVALYAVSEVVRLQKLLTTYIRILERGTVYPITPSYNEMVETFRTSCSKPNLQNQGRGGGVRKCYWPRVGWVYAFCDYDTLEMRTLAQNCISMFGYSDIAEAINSGRDLHVDLATETLGGMTYEEALTAYKNGDKIVAEVRQNSKIGNYGFAGGMGPDSFIEYCRGYGVEMTRSRAVEIHAAFRCKWREMVDYFNHISVLSQGRGAERVEHPLTGMIRGEMNYTALCNFFFQHLAAVGATAALYNSVKEMYVPNAGPDGKNSPLYGCRAWLFNHDEVGMEIPYDAFGVERSHAAAMRLQVVMIESMKVYCPDVEIGATVSMARRWHKGAQPIVVDGFLRPVKPVKNAAGRTEWHVDDDDTQGAVREEAA